MIPHVGLSKPLALKDQVYNVVRDRLRQGEISAEDRLVDAALARDLNISRTPVREALQLLVHEGLLVTTTRGFRLGQLGQSEVADLFELRLLLEPQVARKAAAIAPGPRVDQMVACVARAQATARGQSAARFNAATYQFFESLTALCDNGAMVRSVLLYHDRLAQLRVRLMAAQANRVLAAQGFADIARAVTNGDADAAQAAAIHHISNGINACRVLGLMAKE